MGYPLVDADAQSYAAAYPAADAETAGYHLELWHGPGLPLLFSGLALAGGVAVHLARRPLRRLHHRTPVAFDAQLGYDVAVGGVDRVAVRVTGRLQVGSLPAVTAAFRLPPAPERLPLRPLRLLALAVYLAYDLVVTGLQVSWLTLRDGPRVRGVVLAVPLLAASDRVVAVVANAFSLSPGTMAVQIDREHGEWFVYVLGPRDRAGAERARRGALAMQRRVLAALGTPEELAAADRSLA